MIVRRVFRKSSRRAGEHGGALVFVLVFICIVGLSGVAVLDLSEVTYRAQTAVIENAEIEYTSSNAINSAIELIRRDASGKTGRDRGGLGDVNGEVYCDDPDNPEVLSEYVEDDGTVVVVECTPDDGSGQRNGGDADVLDAVVVTLGGATGDGNDDGSDPGDEEKIPFCDDHHGRVAGECEAGIFLGSADNNVPGEGGLVISGNGNEDEYVVKSNSSVIVRDGGDPDRVLKVEGGIWARRTCSTRVIAQWDGMNGATPDCTTADDTARTLMTIDDCSAGKVCYPYLPRVSEIDALRDWVEPAWFTDQPARMIPVGSGAAAFPVCNSSGFVIFEPGYYDDAAKINNLMDNCGDTLFHFQPGVYYFDFQGGPSATIWTEPRGDNGKLSQIVGGARTTSGEHAWEPCNIGQDGAPAIPLNSCPRQPPKTMLFNLLNGSSSWTNRPETTFMNDNGSGTAVTNNTRAWLEWYRPQVRIPERSGTTVHEVSVTIRHKAPSDAASYWSGWPRLTVRLPGGANCDFVLQSETELMTTERFVLFSDNEPIDTCPAGSKTTGWDAKLAEIATNPGMVNNISLVYEAKAKNVNTSIQGEVDGVSMEVEYTGRPAPDFPAGCDPKQPDSGVQFVFGNTSRMNFNANNAFVELCGHRGGAEVGGQYATAIYGTAEHAADAPRRFRTRSANADIANLANVQFPLMSDPVMLDARVGNIDSSANGLSDPGQVPGILKSAPWSTGGTARLAFKTETVVDPSAAGATADFIPPGSVITGVELRVRHAEGAPPNTGYPSDATDTSVIGTVNLVIRPGVAGDGATSWSTALPKCGDFNMPASKPECDFRYGAFSDTPGNSPITSRPEWSAERSLLDALDTPGAWNGAEIELQYLNTTPASPKVAWVDGIELTVHFRPPGTLRPLAGCLTTRPRDDPHASGSNVMVGTDRDWAPDRDSDQSDRTYQTGTNYEDVYGCALVRTFSSQTSGVKLHIEGMVYAPTAAIDLSGKDNEAPFVTDAIIVRHLTTWRWREGPAVSAFGEDEGSRENRRVWLSVEKDGVEVDRALVEFEDGYGDDFGEDVAIEQWLRRPESPAP